MTGGSGGAMGGNASGGATPTGGAAGLDCQDVCPEARCSAYSDDVPYLHVALEEREVDPYRYRGGVSVIDRTDVGLVLELNDGMSLSIGNHPDAEELLVPVPTAAPGDTLWLELYLSEPTEGSWYSFITRHVSLRASEQGAILLGGIWDNVGVLQDNAGLGVPLKTSTHCSSLTSDGCVEKIRHTEYQITVEGDAPVTVAPGTNALVQVGGASYRLWLEQAFQDEYLTPYECADGGPAQTFHAVILPE